MPPIRKRSEELQRPRHRQGAGRDDVTYGELREIDYRAFEPDPEWDEVAVMIWESALTSGQADYYQNSDLAMLYAACAEMSRYRNSTKPSAMHLSEIIGILSNLLVTEGDRRRARMELQRAPEQKADLKVVAMADYQDYFPDGLPSQKG